MAVQLNAFREAQWDGSSQVWCLDFVVDATTLYICTAWAIGLLGCVGCRIVLKDDDINVELSQPVSLNSASESIQSVVVMSGTDYLTSEV